MANVLTSSVPSEFKADAFVSRFSLAPKQSCFGSDASLLGWPPGRWAKEFTYLDTRFVFDRAEKRNSELQAVHYRATTGTETFVVFND